MSEATVLMMGKKKQKELQKRTSELYCNYRHDWVAVRNPKVKWNTFSPQLEVTSSEPIFVKQCRKCLLIES